MIYRPFAILTLILLLAVGVPCGNAQEVSVRQAEEHYPQNYFRWPLNLPIDLAGTFGEIRSNHYHSGIDLRIGGKVGEPVYAAAEGYVSRINISAWGGGKVLYIDHPNGYRTVYMHLDGFADSIGRYVARYQREHECFAFDINIPAGTLPVRKGELVAYAGNTGSSGGPHLHYEIRHANNDETIDALYFGPPHYTDELKPMIRGIRFYPKQGSSVDLDSNEAKVPGPFYVGIYATDAQLKGVSTKNGPEVIELYVDDTLFFRYRTGHFMFEETRSVNAVIDYRQYQKNRDYYIITRHLPALRLDNHQAFRNEGWLNFDDTLKHKLTCRVADLSGNDSVRTFYVVQVHDSTAQQVVTKPAHKGIKVHYKTATTLNKTQFCAVLPPYTTYDDDELIYSTWHDKRFLSDVHKLTLACYPMPPHQAYRIRIKRPAGDASKMVIVRVDGTNTTAYATTMEGDWLTAKVKDFGSYAVSRDIEAPKIKPANFKDGKPLKSNSLRIRVTDNLSGLDTYKCYVDSTWVLSEYDGKTASLSIDAANLHADTNSLRVVAKDAVGNTAEENYKIIIKTPETR